MELSSCQMQLLNEHSLTIMHTLSFIYTGSHMYRRLRDIATFCRRA